MAAVPPRVSSHLPPSRVKPVSNTSSQNAPLAKSPISRPETPETRLSSRQILSNPLSEQATIFLVRRTLCSQLADKGAPISDLLPPLTSSNDVDLQLYAIIAIILREFVYTWYAKITPDQTFVEEVVKIIAHCTRALEQRLRKVDLEAMLFDELPELLDAHVKAYRTAHNPLYLPPLESDPRYVYHSLWPHPALSPVPGKNDPASALIQKENEAAYRQLMVQGILAILLPTEDLQNDCLTSLVGQIFSDMILGNGVGGKACEPWLLWEGITKIAEAIQAKLPGSKAQQRVNKSASDAPNTERAQSAGAGEPARSRWSPKRTFWIILQYAFFAFTTVRFIIISIAMSSSLPSRLPPSGKLSGTGPVAEDLQPLSSNLTKTSQDRGAPLKRPILSMKIWACASNILDLDFRMPWLSGTLSLLQWFALRGPGQIGYTDGMADKLLSHTICTHVLEPAVVPPLLRTVRAALFPNNAPAPTRIPPSSAEALAIRRRCAVLLLDLIPGRLREVYFGLSRSSSGSSGSSSLSRDSSVRRRKTNTNVDNDTEKGNPPLGTETESRQRNVGSEDSDPSQQERETEAETETVTEGNAQWDGEREREWETARMIMEVESVLDMFGDKYCNRHFMYGVVELVLVRLMPELAEKGIMELREERLS